MKAQLRVLGLLVAVLLLALSNAAQATTVVVPPMYGYQPIQPQTVLVVGEDQSDVFFLRSTYDYARVGILESLGSESLQYYWVITTEEAVTYCYGHDVTSQTCAGPYPVPQTRGGWALVQVSILGHVGDALYVTWSI